MTTEIESLRNLIEKLSTNQEKVVRTMDILSQRIDLLEFARGLTPDDADSGQPCPSCDGKGSTVSGGMPYNKSCDVCNGTGQV